MIVAGNHAHNDMAGDSPNSWVCQFKEAGFEVMDKIRVTYTGSEKAESIFAKYAESISSEVLAEEVTKAEPAGYVKEWKINGEQVTMGVWKEGM